MHVLITTPAFPPFVGGGERYTGTLAKNLVDRGHTVTVFTSAAVYEPDFWQGCGWNVVVDQLEPGLSVIRVPLRAMPGKFRGLLAWRKSMIILAALPGTRPVLQAMARRVPDLVDVDQALSNIKQPVDVVHGFNISWEHTLLTGWQYAREKGLPFIATPFAHLGTGPGDRVALNSTMRHQLHMLSTADMLLTLTPLEARGLQESGVTQNNIRVVGSGVSMPENMTPFPPEGESLKPYVLFVGRTSYDKGAMHAVQAVLNLRERGSDVRLVIIGRETDEFCQFFADLSPADRQAVHLMGYADEDLKHAYLRNAEVLLLPSRSDSFGIVLLESWLNRRPVIAAAAGGIPGVVDNGKNGILVPFGDITSLANAIQLVTSDDELNRVLGENGYQKLMDNYTWEVVTDTVLEAYDDVVAARRLKTRVS